MSSWLSDLALALPSVAPAALAAVSVAVIVVLAIPGCLGRHVYDELLEDILKRRRVNGWDPEVAVSAQPVSTPEPIAGESDGRIEVAVRDAAVWAESEVARVRQEAELTLARALAQARADADRERAAAVRETQAAAAAELARVKQEAEQTLAAKLQEARSEITAAAEGRIADVRKEAEATLAQARADADRERAAELARVQQETERPPAVKLPESPPTPTADVVPMVQHSAPTRKQTIEEHIQEARAKLARQKQDFSV